MTRFALVCAVLLTTACIEETTQSPTSTGTLQIDDLVVGTGSVAAVGNRVTVHYVGTLTSGTQFDNSYSSNQPISFVLGSGQVIAGFDQGIRGMRVGGKRRVTCPPDLAYGNQSVGNIPPNSTLIFEIDLIALS